MREVGGVGRVSPPHLLVVAVMDGEDQAERASRETDNQSSGCSGICLSSLPSGEIN